MITHAKGSTRRRRRRKSHPKESIRNTDPRKRDHAKTETETVKVKVKMRTEGLPSARSTDPVTTKRVQNPPPPLLLRLLRLLLLQLEKRRNLQGVLIPLENRAG